MYWYPQALFAAEQACRRRIFCFWKTTRLFLNMSVFEKNKHVWLMIFRVFTYFWVDVTSGVGCVYSQRLSGPSQVISRPLGKHVFFTLNRQV